MTSKAPAFVLSVEQYIAAFRMIEGKMTGNQRKMLTEYYNSFCHLTTATVPFVALRDVTQYASGEELS